jgi:hypothetical protein
MCRGAEWSVYEDVILVAKVLEKVIERTNAIV